MVYPNSKCVNNGEKKILGVVGGDGPQSNSYFGFGLGLDNNVIIIKFLPHRRRIHIQVYSSLPTPPECSDQCHM